MWQYILEQLKNSMESQGPIFWPEVDRETEHMMLFQLFSVAIRGNILSSGQIERFLLRVSGTGDSLSSSDGLVAATRELLEMDEKLSPLGIKMYGKRLLATPDREALKYDLILETGSVFARSDARMIQFQ